MGESKITMNTMKIFGKIFNINENINTMCTEFMMLEKTDLKEGHVKEILKSCEDYKTEINKLYSHLASYCHKHLDNMLKNIYAIETHAKIILRKIT